MSRIVKALACTLILVGCKTKFPDTNYTLEDKKIALETYGLVEHSLTLEHDHLVQKVPTTPNVYLTFHHGFVWSGSKEKKLLEHLSFALSFEEQESGAPDPEPIETLKDPTWGENVTTGRAAPISDDGYFLTAKHVLEGEDNIVIYAQMEEDFTLRYDIKALRLVHSFDGIDLAICHAPIPTDRYLRMTWKTPYPGDIIYSGTGKQLSAGKIKKITSRDRRSKKELPPGLNLLVTSFPAMKGDSGSPIINLNGDLAGILTDTITGRSKKMKTPESLGYHIAPEIVFSIIEKDRKRILPHFKESSQSNRNL